MVEQHEGEEFCCEGLYPLSLRARIMRVPQTAELTVNRYAVFLSRS